MSKRIRHHVNPLGIRTEHMFEGFDNTRDIIVDIGAFKGEFIAGLSQQFPLWNYIALEVRSRIAERLEKRFARDKNIMVFDGDGTRNFRALLEPSQNKGVMIREVYINFPDPWPKERHKKRRIITKNFLQQTGVWIDARTTWIFQTDRKDVFDETIEILKECEYSYELFHAPPHGVTTDWEDAKVALGEPIYRMRFWIGATIDVVDQCEAPEAGTTMGDLLIGAMASIMLYVLFWLRADDGH